MTAPEFVALAMFPLESVFLPGQHLPLRIFEPRYGALVRHCLEAGEPFGVVLISRGREVGGGDARCDVGVLASIVECVDEGAGRYTLSCRTGARILLSQWLPDDPYPRAHATVWPDQPSEPVSRAQVLEVEDKAMALFERIADARGVTLPSREVLLGGDTSGDAGDRLLTLAARIPIGTADRYSVLAAPSAAERLAALSEAVDAVAEVVQFQLSE
ncbi:MULTISPECIES: LON peptidase substrate-binding domain-containing protein [unclassified Mycobacterium]|uniref:LON peptidase substrate-binding domain-containing protein n=1 Tax=unclassified Mycobacterium TaxID=2642494 RepID=UPI000801CF48|nr:MULTISPECIES: LON peptidase substrate-binding domain-containing protein [unclassified Mycobacterium]OBG71034.1 ATP-dependent protease [Mycobacterium sp. E1214]OBH26001.1 ATP-dependent protease [Mycobacterium sp. E1319]